MLFVLKPTSSCNGACVYCSAWKEDPEDRHRMSQGDLEQLLGRIGEWAASARPSRLSLLWHGGEPLMMGKAFFRRALYLGRELAQSRGLELRHLMQSNITLVDEEWASLLGELLEGRRIGSSFDPFPGVRLLRGGGDYEAEWRRGYGILRAAGIRVGVVCVVHRGHLGRAGELLEAFLDMGYDGGLRLNPLYAAGLAALDHSLHITPEEWGDFLWELWGAWNRLGRPLRVDPLQSWDRMARGEPTRLACAFSGHCTEGFTGVRADGAVFSCGRSMDSDLAQFGNLFEEPLQKILGCETRRALLNRTAWLRQHECSGCRWWVFCHGGCPNDALLAHGDPLRPTGFCQGRRSFLERAFGAAAAAGLGEAGPAPDCGDYLFDVGGEGQGGAGETAPGVEDD
ncbi:MAG: radical SAM protein [Polyangia bacterium]|jgi:uncharacterized protein|nr:radical SAM protein [Polyangia bacterium]